PRMVLKEWQAEFPAGVPDADFEHQQLIELINKLYDNISANNSADGVSEFPGAINAQVSGHRLHENKIMRECRYDQLADYTQGHERLPGNIHTTMDAREENGSFSAEEFTENIQHWFIGHFETHASRLHKLLEQDLRAG
ncbi:MAG: hemerythrin domain-containing protein, partial [Gammaproteobacteria bacterium]